MYVSRAIYNTVIAINNKLKTVSNQTGSSTLSSDEVQRTSLITKIRRCEDGIHIESRGYMQNLSYWNG